MRAGLRFAVCCIAFVALSAPLVRVGKPETRALSMLSAQAVTPQIAFLGDSRPHVGISPKRVMAELAGRGFPGATAHNYAEDGSDTLHHHAILVTGLLRRPDPPRVVVLATNPLAFDSTRKNNRLDQLPPSVLPSLARAGAPLELLLDVGTMSIFPPYRARPKIKETVELTGEKVGFALAKRQSALGLSFEVRPERREYKHYEDGQDPFVVLRDWEYGFQLSFGGYTARYDKLVLGELHFRLVEEMADRAREASCLLVLLEMPSAPPYRTSFGARPIHEEWRTRMSQIAKEHGAVMISHAAFSDDERAFGDPGHMQEPLAAAYSTFLAKELAENEAVKAALAKER